MLCTLTHRLADSPATLALFTLSFFRFDFKLTAVINNFNFGNYECCTKLRLSLFKEFKCFAACTKCYLCFKRTLNCLILYKGFEWLFNIITKFVDSVPESHKFIVNINSDVFGNLIKDNMFCILIWRMRHVFPNFIWCIRKERSNHSCHCVKDNIDYGLSSSSWEAVSLFCIKSVLENIKIEVRHINNTEVVNAVIYNMKLIIIVWSSNLCDKVIKLCKCPFINRQHLVKVNHICIGIKVRNVTENVSCGISDFSVWFGNLLEDILGNMNISLIVGWCNPKSKYISTVLLNNILWADAVTKWLTHLSWFIVKNHTVSKNSLVRCSASCSNGCKEWWLEPTSVLVVTLKVKVSRWFKVITLFKNSGMRWTAIEPNIHNIFFFIKFSTTALLTLCTGRKNLCGCVIVQSVWAFCTE